MVQFQPQFKINNQDLYNRWNKARDYKVPIKRYAKGILFKMID